MTDERFADGGEPNPAERRAEVAAVRERVLALLPSDEQGVLPLCFTIEEQIHNRLRDVSPELVRIVLREITVGSDYLRRILNDEWRHALNGVPVERIQRYQREFASGVLALRELWLRDDQGG